MLLDLQNVSKIYRTGNEQVLALDDASLSLDVGEFTAVAGPSGCGKSTLIKVILGDQPVDSGVVRLGTNLEVNLNDSTNIMDWGCPS